MLAVAHRLDQQISQRPSLELHLAQDVEDLASQRLPRLLHLLEEGAIYLAFASLLSHQVPEVTNFRLPDAMDPAKPLLDPVRVPGQVVVHHQVCPLEVDTLPRRVGRHQDLHLGIVFEGFLRLRPFLPTHAAVDADEGLFPPEESRNPLLKVIEGVAMLGEYDQFFMG